MPLHRLEDLALDAGTEAQRHDGEPGSPVEVLEHRVRDVLVDARDGSGKPPYAVGDVRPGDRQRTVGQRTPDQRQNLAQEPFEGIDVRWVSKATDEKQAVAAVEVVVGLRDAVAQVERNGTDDAVREVPPDLAGFDIGRGVDDVAAFEQPELQCAPACRFGIEPMRTLQFGLARRPQEMQVVAEVEDLGAAVLADRAEVFRRDLRPMQVSVIDVGAVCPQPVLPVAAIPGAVQHLDAELLQAVRIAGMAKKVVTDERHPQAALDEPLDVLKGRSRAGVAILARYPVVDDQHRAHLRRALAGHVQGPTRRQVRALEHRAPFAGEYVAIARLVALDADHRVLAVRYPFEMDDHRTRLVEHAEAERPGTECEIDVLVVGRRIAGIEAADAPPQFGAHAQAGAGHVIDVADVIVFGASRIASATIVPGAAIAPDDATGFLLPAIRVDQPGADDADVRMPLAKFEQAREPALRDPGIVVEQYQPATAGRRACPVAGVQESGIGRVAHDTRIDHRPFDVDGGVGRRVVGDDHLVIDARAVLQHGMKAVKRRVVVIVGGDDDADGRTVARLREAQGQLDRTVGVRALDIVGVRVVEVEVVVDDALTRLGRLSKQRDVQILQSRHAQQAERLARIAQRRRQQGRQQLPARGHVDAGLVAVVACIVRHAHS